VTNKKLIVFVCFIAGCLLIIVAAFLFINQLNQPVHGTTNVGQGTVDNQNNISFSVSLTPKLQTTKYASYNYPSGLNLNTTTQISPPSVATLEYNAKDVQSWTLTVDITNNPTGNLSNNSAFMVRTEEPNEYHQSKITLNGQPVILMTDITVPGFSELAFLIHGNLLATVSLMGDDANGIQPLQTAFNMVLNSWHWLV